ncbi:hypothetical protein ULG90_16265 [Halopseudomonas pachastrellae]|nr:hypothetical protein ULG90_16265 [Halopseudomonas pachastrellae]
MRGEDSGLVMPIMIANGRRIDQRSTMAQVGGVDWLREHLALNGFDPIDIDGRDPAAFAWAIISMGRALRDAHQAIVNGDAEYPVRLPYAIAETVKGFGFPGLAPMPPTTCRWSTTPPPTQPPANASIRASPRCMSARQSCAPRLPR